MKYRALIPAVVLLAISSMSGQMVSAHGSKQPAAAPADPNRYFAASSQSDASLSKPVARVNGTVLTNKDLLREEYAIFPYARQHNGIPKGMEPQIRKGALQMIVFEELVYQEAVRQKLTVSDAIRVPSVGAFCQFDADRWSFARVCS